MKKEYDVSKAIAAQKKHVADNEIPHFAPTDGHCYRCRGQIYEKHRITGRGIDVERAGSQLITGCPHCHYSFVD